MNKIANKILKELKGIHAKRDKGIKLYELLMKTVDEKEEHIIDSLLEKFGFKEHDEVILHLCEWRDDAVGALRIEQKLTCYIIGVRMETLWKDGLPTNTLYLAPIVCFKTKNGKNFKKTPIYYNSDTTWKLYKDDKVVMKCDFPSVIIKNKYTKNKLNEMRKRYSLSQKYS